MAITPYSTVNQSFSDLAHEVAVHAVYPALFRCDRRQLSFETTSVSQGGRGAILDGEMAVDRIVKVRHPELKAPLTFTVQERFRRMKFSRYNDLTISEYNDTSRRPSELYKMTAGIFLCGFFDDNEQTFDKWIAADVNKLLFRMATGTLPHTKSRNKRSNQTFICIQATDLLKSGCVLAIYDRQRWGIAK